MTNSKLADFPQLRRFTLRQLSSCIVVVVASLCWGAISQAQEKSSESLHNAGWVVIPVDEYRVLRAKAYPVEHDPEPPPLDATLTRVDYELHIVGDLAAGRASLTVDVLRDGWVRVPVPTGLLVREARLDGKPVSLVAGAPGKGGTHLCALLSHAGRFQLLLDVDVPVTSSAGDESLSLPSSESGVTRAAVLLPRQGVDLRIGGGLLSEKSETASETKWLAYARGNEALTFTWRKKTEDHHVEMPLRLRGSLTQLTSLAEDSTSIYAEAKFDIVQGAAREVHIQLPEQITINQVAGAVVADWEMKNGELAVTFLEPVEHSARFVISGESRLPRDGIIDIPLLRLLNTERDEGGVAVEVLGAGEIKGQKSEGLEEADATDLGDTVASRQSPALVAFRARPGVAGKTRSLSVNIARYDQQAVLMANIEEARYQVLMSTDGKELVQARYAVRNNQRNFVKVTLPAGATVWSVALGGKPVRPGQSPDGSLLLPLEKSRGEEAPAFAVEILYLTKAAKWDEKGRERVTLPALDLPISRTGLLLYYPPLFHVTAEPGTFRTQEYVNPMSAALMPPNPAIGGGVSVNSPPAAMPKELDRLEILGRVQSADSNGNFHGLGDHKDATQALLDSFRAKSNAGKVTGILPINVSFPAFGPSIFLVSELTSENQFPAAEFNFQRDKKGGVR
ncbi:MAG TPA: hypothetical protein VGM18_08175 [Candidatus Sulfotelmatobacter sp.]|jgi:hypothetical protein